MIIAATSPAAKNLPSPAVGAAIACPFDIADEVLFITVPLVVALAVMVIGM